ncbi:MAG: hypothetical protein ABIS09_10450 [Sphingomicrobium sp.]
MSHSLALAAVSLLSIAGASIASAAPPTQSPSRLGSPASRVYVRKFETPPTAVCPPHYEPEHTGYYARAYCPDIGEARQRLISGQVIPAGFGQPIGYAQLNSELRAQYRLNPERDYVFANGYLYDIDPATKTIKRVIPVLVQR